MSRRLPSFLLVSLLTLAIVLLGAAGAIFQYTDLKTAGFIPVIVALGVAGSLLLGFLALGWQWWVRRPLQALRAALEQFGRGDFSATLPPAGSPTVAHLIEALNAAAIRLAEHERQQHEAEVRLQASERRYRRLVELSPEAIFVCNHAEITFVNWAGARLLGATEPAQLVSRMFWDCLHPETRELARDQLGDLEPAGPSTTLEVKLLRLDGSAVDAEVSLAPLDEAGRSAALIILRDITERKQTEASLRASEALFRTLADQAPVLMWIARPDGQRTFFNQPWLDFTGRDLSQESGLGWTDDLHPDDYQRYLEAYVAAIKARRSFEVEYRLRRADGQYRWLASIGVPHFTPERTLAGYIGVCFDISERHAAEAALRLAHDQFAFILQSAADGITAQDPAGRLRYANEAAAQMLGYSSAAALTAEAWPAVWQRLEVFDEAGQPFPAELWPGRRALDGVVQAAATVRLQPRSGGEGRWLAIKATPVFNDSGQIELAVNIFQDMTELRHAGLSHRLLAEAGRLLAAPLDNAARLVDVPRLVVPLLADWCALDVVSAEDEAGGVRRVAAAAAAGRPFSLSTPRGADRVMQTGVAELYPFVPNALLEALARDQGERQALEHLDLKSVMLVPLLARGKPVGALTFVQVESRRRYSRADLALAEELARQVALVLDNAQLYDQAQKLAATLEQRVQTRTTQLLAMNMQLAQEVAEREAAQRRLEDSQAQLRRLSAHLQAAREEERIVMAREIHDELGQALAGLKMDVAWLQRSLPAGTPALGARLEDMSVLIDGTVQTVRRLSAELRPSLLDDVGLAAALEWQLDEFQARTGLVCDLTIQLGAAPLAAEWATALFRIAQEALTNVARHAAATQVSVTLDDYGQALTLCVQDNGRGITEAELAESKSFGLLGMRERVYLLNGTLEIHGAPGQGTRITGRVPLSPEVRP